VAFTPKGKLPKLDRQRYRGHAVVFWTLTLQDRAQGWLTPRFHLVFREMLLHTAARYAVWCPAYCLMPDHLHVIWMGLRLHSDQLNAMRFLRRHLDPALGEGRRWQHQAHDHVLREEERERDAFARTCFYILENPVRAGLVSSAGEWPYSGAVVPGYPWLHPLGQGYWERFWKLYAAMRQAEPPPPALPVLRESPTS
jgi:putative transposase